MASIVSKNCLLADDSLQWQGLTPFWIQLMSQCQGHVCRLSRRAAVEDGLGVDDGNQGTRARGRQLK